MAQLMMTDFGKTGSLQVLLWMRAHGGLAGARVMTGHGRIADVRNS
jgi:hypothetical protein